VLSALSIWPFAAPAGAFATLACSAAARAAAGIADRPEASTSAGGGLPCTRFHAASRVLYASSGLSGSGFEPSSRASLTLDSSSLDTMVCTLNAWRHRRGRSEDGAALLPVWAYFRAYRLPKAMKNPSPRNQQLLCNDGARGGTRTRTPVAGKRILSHFCMLASY